MPSRPASTAAASRDYGVHESEAGQQHPTVFITFEVTGRYDPATGELSRARRRRGPTTRRSPPKTDRLAASPT